MIFPFFSCLDFSHFFCFLGESQHTAHSTQHTAHKTQDTRHNTAHPSHPSHPSHSTHYTHYTRHTRHTCYTHTRYTHNTLHTHFTHTTPHTHTHTRDITHASLLPFPFSPHTRHHHHLHPQTPNARRSHHTPTSPPHHFFRPFRCPKSVTVCSTNRFPKVGSLERLFNQWNSEQTVCLVQTLVPRVVAEHRVLCFRDPSGSFHLEPLWMLRSPATGRHHVLPCKLDVEDFQAVTFLFFVCDTVDGLIVDADRLF